jgi:hypothetical protein
MQFETQIKHGFRVIDKLRLCSEAIVIFCTCFETGVDDNLFRDLYARDLTFRSTWLDFLTSLLTYVETMNTCETVKRNKKLESYVLQTRTLIKNARKQLNIERNMQANLGLYGTIQEERRLLLHLVVRERMRGRCTICAIF